MTAESITIFRATIKMIGAMNAFLYGPYRLTRSDAEVDRIRLLKDRAENGRQEIFAIQIIPAVALDDGQVAMVIPIGGELRTH